MNWYSHIVSAQQQYLWDNDPLLPEANIDRTTLEMSGDLGEDVSNSKSIGELQSILVNYGIGDIEEIVFAEAKERIWVFPLAEKLTVIELSFPYPDMLEAEEWLYRVGGDNAWQYVDARDFNGEFWDDAGEGQKAYHGTYEENLNDIMLEGIAPMDKTRGIENRSTGAAVFTSPTPEAAFEHYPIVLEIDIGRMRMDGYMPNVSKEGPIDESEALGTLAHKIGLDDFYADYEQGLDPETVIFYDTIPKRYIKVLK